MALKPQRSDQAHPCEGPRTALAIIPTDSETSRSLGTSSFDNEPPEDPRQKFAWGQPKQLNKGV